MIRWYVAYTQPGKENLAAGQLLAQGFKTYLPKYRKTIRHARKVKNIKVPLFPRYLFVKIDLDRSRWRAIDGTRGVSHLLTMGEKPSAIPSGIVEEIKSRESQEKLIELEPYIPYDPGDSLEVTAGALSCQVGNFIRVDTNQRIVMLLQLLGRELEVRLQPEDVQAYA
jgi:transcriptional antiterminator RfaH